MKNNPTSHAGIDFVFMLRTNIAGLRLSAFCREIQEQKIFSGLELSLDDNNCFMSEREA